MAPRTPTRARPRPTAGLFICPPPSDLRGGTRPVSRPRSGLLSRGERSFGRRTRLSRRGETGDRLHDRGSGDVRAGHLVVADAGQLAIELEVVIGHAGRREPLE